MDPARASVAIIGGGIGGLCLAIGLIKRGVPVNIFEQAAEFKEVGLGIGFGPNAIKAMQLIDPAIVDEFQSLVTENDSASVEENLKTWINFRDGREANPRFIAKVMTCYPYQTGIGAALRASFLDRLVKLIPGNICHFGKKLVNWTEHPSNNSTTLEFEDGSTHEAHAVIGCDGIKSTARSLLFKERCTMQFLKFTGEVAVRALIPATEAEMLLGQDLAHNAQMFLFPGGHVLTYPVDGHAFTNVIAVVQSSTWEHEDWVIRNGGSKFLKDAFLAAGPLVRNLTEKMEKHGISTWALWDSNPLPTFYQENVALLGDAAHASLPHQGAGAGSAIEDALVLATVLANAQGNNQVVSALSAYDAIRRPRSQEIVKTSREAGRLYKFLAPQGDDLCSIRDNLLTRMNWIWYEDQEMQVKRAVAVMEALERVCGRRKELRF